jgi:hypothetical protein
MKRLGFVFMIMLVLSIGIVLGHQPRLVYNENLGLNNARMIENPEVSQAFYGNLKGSEEYFLIDSEKKFDFYAGILSPDIENARKDFKVQIYFNNKSIILMQNGWTRFYEEFAGDWYWQGPEGEFNAEPGKYIIKVSNPDNAGKYVLVVGKIESFPIGEALKTLLVLPKLKKDFFEKCPCTAYNNKIGEYLLLGLTILAILGATAYFIIQTLRKAGKRVRRR